MLHLRGPLSPAGSRSSPPPAVGSPRRSDTRTGSVLRPRRCSRRGAAGGPVNILAWQAPPVSRLAELGVARVSYGSAIQHRLLQNLATILAEIRDYDSAHP